MLKRALLAVFVVVACAGVAQADLITLNLSTHSSDATPASDLDAIFVFEVTGSNSLKLSVTNPTGSAFNINAIYFNGPDSLTSFQLRDTPAPPAGWEFMTNEMADGFGSFDFAMIDGTGQNNPNVINPGETLIFRFDFTTTTTVSAADFAFSGSTEGFFAAAKFVNGPGDDSAFGAIIPLPPALPMGIAGLVGVVFLGRRMRATKPRRAA